MAEGSRPCERCGSVFYKGDEFCGVCGAKIPTAAQDAAPTQEMVGPSYAPEDAPTRGGNRKRVLAIAVSALLVLLVGTGAVAYATLGLGLDPLGWSGSQPSDAEENPPAQEEPAEDTSPESTSTAPVSPDDPPDPAFDQLLPTLKQRTTAPIMLPADLPDELGKPAIDGYVSGGGEEYGIVFPFGPKEIVAKVSNAETLGTLNAYPEGEDQSNEFFDAERVEQVVLPDGTEATLRYMVPAGRAGSQGPFWEGKFDKDGFTYNLKMIKPDEIAEEEVKQALSTMVEVPQEEGASEERTAPRTPSNFDPPTKSERTSGNEKSPPTQRSRSDLEAEAEEAAGDYYRAAGSEDWEYTYDNLDSSTKSEFTREEWRKKNQWFADNSPAIYNIESVELDESSQKPLAEVEVRLTGEDGSSSIRNTYFVFEDGKWLHRFAQEENDLFKPGTPFEEWVEAQ